MIWPRMYWNGSGLQFNCRGACYSPAVRRLDLEVLYYGKRLILAAAVQRSGSVAEMHVLITDQWMVSYRLIGYQDLQWFTDVIRTPSVSGKFLWFNTLLS